MYIMCTILGMHCCMFVYLTVPSVVNFTTEGIACAALLLVDGACKSLWITFAAAFCSVHVGSDCSGHDIICPTVSFEGENAGDDVLLQPDST